MERRSSFQRFAELLFAQSGGIFEATRFAKPCEVSRTTISNYLNVLEATFVVHVIRPFSRRRSTEIVSAPKVYGFDTGFVCFHRGWHELRPEDAGALWEHFVLNEVHSQLQTRRISYWRDKRGHEVDFVYVRRGKAPVAIECKWSADEFDAGSLLAFRRQYVRRARTTSSPGTLTGIIRRSFQGVSVKFVALAELDKGSLLTALEKVREEPVSAIADLQRAIFSDAWQISRLSLRLQALKLSPSDQPPKSRISSGADPISGRRGADPVTSTTAPTTAFRSDRSPRRTCRISRRSPQGC